MSTANDLMMESSPDKEKAVSLDLKSLRAVRVIRPLKLVNGVPSKKFQIIYTKIKIINIQFVL